MRHEPSISLVGGFFIGFLFLFWHFLYIFSEILQLEVAYSVFFG